MLEIKCHACYELLAEQGALLFSPPTPNAGSCNKFHICKSCYEELKGIMVRVGYKVRNWKSSAVNI